MRVQPIDQHGATTWPPSRAPRRALLLAAAITCGPGCRAPIADLRPPSALVRDDRTFETGGGVAAVTPRPYVEEPGHQEGQIWFTGKVRPWLLLSGVGALDLSGSGAAGAADKRSALGGVGALARLLKTDRVVAGVGTEVGYAWMGASLSTGVRLFDDTWLYAAPRVFNWGIEPAVAVPVGASVHVAGGFVLRAETQVSWEGLKYYNRRFHFAGAAAYEW